MVERERQKLEETIKFDAYLDSNPEVSLDGLVEANTLYKAAKVN